MQATSHSVVVGDGWTNIQLAADGAQKGEAIFVGGLSGRGR
jgi:hypothetical protein